MFNAKKAIDNLTKWINDFFEQNGKGCNAVIGISGGKDSSVVAALCVKALGKERVIGVLMPSGEQHDIDMAYLLVKHLDICHFTVNIKDCVDGLINNLPKEIEITSQTIQNIPPRVRMTTLYAISQSNNGRVVNTCNLSEDWVGYSTRYGDSVGDFSPLANFTVTEVKEIGRELGLPDVLVDKVPSDGLCGKTDEDNLGFSYKVLDKYIRTGICEDIKIKEIIDKKHFANKFKLKVMPSYNYEDNIIKAKD
ncbi:MAG: NAD(+) synthase [Clostridia bacterium]|nr:NAD(+) synthase [Clostridia bacterium]